MESNSDWELVWRTLARHASCREFSERPVAATLVEEAITRAQQASTSSHVQAYSLIRVTNVERRQKLVELTGGQPYVAESPLFWIVCADERRHHLVCREAGQEHAQNFETFLVAVIDAALFAQNLVVALEARELGVCYIGGLRTDLAAVSELFDLPPFIYPLFGLCAGYPSVIQEVKPRLPRVAYTDRYPQDEELLDEIREHDRVMASYYERRNLMGRIWSRGIQKKFERERRASVLPYYESQGAHITEKPSNSQS